MLTFILHGEEETLELGAKISPLMQQGTVMLLDGPLGAGKTTLVRGLAYGMGLSRDYDIVSPTFTLLNIYPTRVPLYHADFYRLSDNDIADMDIIEQAINGVLVVEWHKKYDFYGDSAWRINITYQGSEARIVNLVAPKEMSDKIEALLI